MLIIRRKYHFGLFFLAVLKIGIFLLSSSVSHALTLEEILTRIENQFLRSADFQADFVQETEIKSMGQTEREQGRLYCKKPLKMLWDYQKPAAKKLVIEEEKSWLYLPEENIVYTQATEHLLGSSSAVRLLLGLGKITDDFKVQLMPASKGDDKNDVLLMLTPKDPQLGIKNAWLRVTGKSGQVKQVWFEDVYGNVTRLSLSRIKFNQNLKNELFKFVPPKNVEVYPLS
ncbi:MAG: outer membrane lipoprotein carrier protein LolA [Syntrophobacterales bacterium]|nr:outer membrane lipoprotein carrier protein LolA [Syntrophobacterales bacterium]